MKIKIKCIPAQGSACPPSPSGPSSSPHPTSVITIITRPIRQPPQNVRQPQRKMREEKREGRRRTLYCVTRCALILRMSHSSAVTPGAYFPGGARATAAAICGLSSARWWSITVSFGRVKKTSDQRSYCAWSFGGGLVILCVISTLQRTEKEREHGHDAVDVGAEDAATEDVERVADVADRVSWERLQFA